MENKILLIILLFTSTIGFSCTCEILTDRTVMERINETEKIFEGIITNVKSVSEFEYSAEFQITRKIKGVDAFEKISINTMKMGSMCGSSFKKGEKWLIFSSSNSTGKCNGNLVLKNGTLNDYPSSKLPDQYKFYFKKLRAFINQIAELKDATELIEYDKNQNLIAKGIIGKDKKPFGEWFYAPIVKEEKN